MEFTDLWTKFEQMKEMIGVESLLDNLAQSLGTDVLEDHLRFIDRCFECNVF